MGSPLFDQVGTIDLASRPLLVLRLRRAAHDQEIIDLLGGNPTVSRAEMVEAIKPLTEGDGGPFNVGERSNVFYIRGDDGEIVAANWERFPDGCHCSYRSVFDKAVSWAKGVIIVVPL